MFDRLSWYMVLAYLAPLVAAMYFIRVRELAAISTSYRQLSPSQKGWVLLMLLPPGTASRLLAGMAPEVREGYIECGSSIKGSGRNLVKRVVGYAVSQLPPEEKKQAGSNVEENLGRLARWADSEPSQFIGWMRQNFPVS